jgi:AcrR family transcriptional regulator
MGRRSLREERRRELASGFARVLAARGSGGATIAALASEMGVAAGIVHHYFEDKRDLYGALLDVLVGAFRDRARPDGGADPLSAYGRAALALDERADRIAARAWVGLFGEALTDATLFERVRRLIDGEIQRIARIGGLSTQDAAAMLAFVLGALVLGAFAPIKTAGFAAPAFARLLEALRRR